MRKYLQGHLARLEIFHSFWKTNEKAIIASRCSISQRTAFLVPEQNPLLLSFILSHSLTSFPNVIWPTLRQTYLWVQWSGCISRWEQPSYKHENICWVFTVYQEQEDLEIKTILLFAKSSLSSRWDHYVNKFSNFNLWDSDLKKLMLSIEREEMHL